MEQTQFCVYPKNPGSFRRCAQHRGEATKRALLLVMLLSVGVSDAAADDPAQLAAEAVRANPGLEALRARAEQLEALVQAAGIWKDPVVGVEYLNAPVDSFRLDESPMSGLQFSLHQELPELGLNRASRERAELRVATSRHEIAEAEAQLRSHVELLFWKLILSNLLEGVTETHLERAEELLGAVRARYEVGGTGQSALLRLTVLRDRLRDDLDDFRRSDEAYSAGLAGALARPVRSRFETPRELVPAAVSGSAAAWMAEALTIRPKLARIREEIGVERQSAKIARISALPEVTLWMKYRLRQVETVVDDGTDFFSAGLSVPIPWGSRKRSRGTEAAHLAAERGASARLDAAIDEIESDLVRIEATWLRAHRKATTYRDDLLPISRATLETTLADFSVAKADFNSLYEAQVELLMLEKAFLSATVETYIQRAAARAAVGALALGDTL